MFRVLDHQVTFRSQLPVRHDVRVSVGLFDVGHMVQSKYAVFLIVYPLSLTAEKLNHFVIRELNLVSVVQLRPPFLNGSLRRRS